MLLVFQFILNKDISKGSAFAKAESPSNFQKYKIIIAIIIGDTLFP